MSTKLICDWCGKERDKEQLSEVRDMKQLLGDPRHICWHCLPEDNSQKETCLKAERTW
jgi:hypothetical protein